MPFTGGAHTYALNDTSIIVDTTRLMRVAATYPRDSGAIVRAIYNVRLDIRPILIRRPLYQYK